MVQKNGFDIDKKNEKYFINKEKYLDEYRIEVNHSLEKYYLMESNSRVNKRTLTNFESQLRYIPRIAKLKLRDWTFSINLSGGKKEQYLKVNPYKSKINLIDKNDFDLSKSKIIMPTNIFNSAVNQNMFHHSGISKRNKYIFTNEEELKKWELMLLL